MALYIKANRLVVQHLHLQDVRNNTSDGNYLLWQADMQAFGPLSNLPATLEMIGGIALMPHEARQEQDGTVVRPLPTATDPRFVPVTGSSAVEPSGTEENNETSVEATAEEVSENEPAAGQDEETQPEEENEPEEPAAEQTQPEAEGSPGEDEPTNTEEE